MSHHHATLSVKKERDFVGTTGNSGCLHSFGLPPSQQQSLNCGSPVEKRSPFLLLPGDHHHHHQQQQQQYSPSVNKEGFEIDMDLAKFLGDPDLHTPTTSGSGGLENSEWNSLFTGTELEGLDVLDPTTGVPTGGAPGGMTEHSFVPGLTTPSYNGHVEVQQSSGSPSSMGGGTDPTWLMEQSQKLERQQQLQQQKLLELEQTLLRTEILKNRLEIVSNLKHASPELQSQLIGALSTRSSSLGINSPPATQSSMATATSVAPRLVSRPHTHVPPVPRSTPQVITPSSLPSPPDSELDDFGEGGLGGGVKKKSHNLIEKKYRTSINDRIGTLRDIVSKHFRDDKKVQKSAVLQKTIDYIRYLENSNRKLLEENRQLKSRLMEQSNTAVANGTMSSSSHTNHSPLSWSEPSDDGHPSSPDVFLSDTSPTGSPPLAFSPSYNSAMKFGGRIFMCVMLVMCFLVDPLSLLGGGDASDGHTHGSQRTLSSVVNDAAEGEEFVFSYSWCLVWGLRLFFAGLCFGWVWLRSLPTHNPEWEGVRFWRLRKQAEKDIKNGDFSSAQVHLVSALTEIGLPLPTSYSSLAFSLFWNGLSHLLFQLYIGQVMVGIISFVLSKFQRSSTQSSSSVQHKVPQVVGYADVAKTKHLLHQIILASYDDRTMHGLGFYLGLTALNYGEVQRGSFSRDQWAELLFVMGVQCQYSCACIASLLAHYYFMCSGSMGGLLSFINTPDGWEYLMSKDWLTDVQTASKQYKGVAVFPKYSITRSYCKALLTEAYQDLLLPDQDSLPRSSSSPPPPPPPSLDEAKKTFESVLAMTRRANGYLVEDMKVLIQDLPTLSDTVTTRDCGFEVLMWWASLGLVSCAWRRGEKGEEHFPIVEDISNGSGSIPSALHLAFKAQRLYHQSSSTPPLSVINQLCSTASHALKICNQELSSENNLHLLGLFLACDWILGLRYEIWKETEGDGVKEDDEQNTMRSLIKGYQQDINVLSQLTSHLPAAFPQLRKYKGYQRLISGGNPILADTFLTVGGESCHLHKRPVSSSAQSS